MSQTTKSRILEAALPLFNEKGFGAPTLYHLSQNLGMSRGNLTYYFKNKEALLLSIIDQLWSKYESSMSHTTKFPTWESTNNSTLAFHELQKKYAFIFFDKQLLEIPEVKDQIKNIRDHHISWQLSIIEFSIKIGNMKKEEIPGTYYNLCRTIWAMSFFWLMSEIYKEKEAEKDWGRYVWSIILPHFSSKGIKSFKNHFGNSYFHSLGESYENLANIRIGL